MTQRRKRAGVYLSIEEYNKAFFPTKETEELHYDSPEEFGKALAKRHIEIVRQALQDWSQESIARS